MLGIFDTHCHLVDEFFEKNHITVADLLTELDQHGISNIACVGTDLKTSMRSVEVAISDQRIFAAVGIHPSEINQTKDDEWKADFEKIKELSHNNAVVAIGETGLNYLPTTTLEEKQQQQAAFLAHLNWSIQINKPIIIHCRDAWDDLFLLLEKANLKQINGIIHCFTGNLECANKLLRYNLVLSFSGIITFKNAKSLAEILEHIDIANIVVETDAPYLAPEPFRGQINRPANIHYIIQKIAKIKRTSSEEVIAITTHNARKVFNL